MLQALYQLAQREQLMEDPDFEWKPVAWLVRVADGGKLLGVAGTHFTPVAVEGRKKPRPFPKNFLLPREAGRTSGDYAFFLFDKAEYVFGLDPEKDPSKQRPPEKLAARFKLFRAKADGCLVATGDAGVAAVSAFLARLGAGELAVELPAECAGNDLFAFVYGPDTDLLVTQRPAVRAYWQEQRRVDPEQAPFTHRCLVSGRPCAPVGKHPPIKNLPGGSTSGVALVSANASAFESYGWAGNDNAPVSREAAEACSTALNRLLHPAFPSPTAPGETLPRRSLRLSADTAVCFWSAGRASHAFEDSLAGLMDGDPSSVAEVYRSLWNGQMPELEDPSAFFALTLTGTQGRAIVRDWIESSVSQVMARLAQHFRDLAIVHLTPPAKGRPREPALGARTLLRSLAVGGDEKNVPAALAAQLIHAGLAGSPYPIALLQRALERSRAESGLDEWSASQRRDARAALIKAVLNRHRRLLSGSSSQPEVTYAMDPTNNQDGYLLGRLMAVIELMQQTAMRDVNASVVDRYFGAASATPRAVFPNLLRNFRHHYRKAKDDPEKKTQGRAAWLNRQSDRILALLNRPTREAMDDWLAGGRGVLQPHLEAFPPFLNLEEQGLFVLGYHHQRHWLFLGKEDRARWMEERGLQPSAEDKETELDDEASEA